jgi:hypothetical protein
VEGECRRTERHQQSRQVLLAVTEAVLGIGAVVLQDVGSLVLDFPSRSAAGGQVGDRVAVDRQVGDEAVAPGDLPGGVARSRTSSS